MPRLFLAAGFVLANTLNFRRSATTTRVHRKSPGRWSDPSGLDVRHHQPKPHRTASRHSWYWLRFRQAVLRIVRTEPQGRQATSPRYPVYLSER